MNDLSRTAAQRCPQVRLPRACVPAVYLDATSRAIKLWRNYRNRLLLDVLGLGHLTASTLPASEGGNKQQVEALPKIRIDYA